MHTFVFQFGENLYKAQGKTATSILSSMFTRQQVITLNFKGWIQIQ